jgi:hypothetical protein
LGVTSKEIEDQPQSVSHHFNKILKAREEKEGVPEKEEDRIGYSFTIGRNPEDFKKGEIIVDIYTGEKFKAGNIGRGNIMTMFTVEGEKPAQLNAGNNPRFLAEKDYIELKHFGYDAIELVNNLVNQKQSFKNIANAVRNTTLHYSDNDIQEMVEFAVQQRARDIQQSNLSDDAKFAHIVELYNNQPTLSKRTSTKVIGQQYSTPAPLAWIMGKLANADKAASVYDPTAGTGMLSVAMPDPEKFAANEIDEKRADRCYESAIWNHG